MKAKVEKNDNGLYFAYSEEPAYLDGYEIRLETPDDGVVGNEPVTVYVMYESPPPDEGGAPWVSFSFDAKTIGGAVDVIKSLSTTPTVNGLLEFGFHDCRFSKCPK